MDHNTQERVIVLVDMDCFYCQVEEKLNPSLKGKPIAVVQYNEWQGGGIIAVNYPARDKGVTRHMRGEQAKKICPEIVLCKVPQVRGKADLNKYRNAGCEVAEVLQKFTSLVERASVDEAYLDITEDVEKRIKENKWIDDVKAENMQNTFVVGYSNTQEFVKNLLLDRDCNYNGIKLAVGGVFVEEIRKAVYDQTGFRCSAGIGHNKIMAKLVSSLHKPNKQTIIPQESIPKLFETIPLSKIQGLGGKFGKYVADKLQINTVGELSKFTEKELIKLFDNKNGSWLCSVGKGTAYEPITTRLIAQSIGCSKRFPGKNALKSNEDITHWVGELAQEISERLKNDFKENNRKAKQIIVTFTHEINGKNLSSSKTVTLLSYEANKIATQALDVLKKFCPKVDGTFAIKLLGISAGNFKTNDKKMKDIGSFFKKLEDNTSNEKIEIKPSGSNIINDKCKKRKFCETEGENVDIYDITSKTGRSKANSSLLDDSLQDISVYSATTEEMFEDSRELEFYSPSKVKSNEIDENAIDESDKKPQSFFKDYLKIMANEKCNKSNEPQQSNWKQLCTECNEMISLFEFDSHKDYHLALKLNDTEDQKCLPSNNQEKREKKTLWAFIEKRDNVDDNTEEKMTCSECNKKIKITEIESHKDYHVAKKLHLELNQPQGPTTITTSKTTSTVRNKKNTLTSYFKPI